MKITSRVCKLLLALTLCILLLCPLATAASAEEPTDGAPAVTTAETVTDTTREEASDATLGGAISDLLREHSAPILSAATFLLTLFISLLFKRRAVPALLESLTAILGKSREAVNAMAEGQEREQAELAAILARAEALLAEVSNVAEAAEAAADTVRKSRDREEALTLILGEQSALLYELLMSANLPQYQKDKIGEAHAAAERALAEKSHA